MHVRLVPRRGWHEALNCKRVGSMSPMLKFKEIVVGKKKKEKRNPKKKTKIGKMREVYTKLQAPQL